MMVLHKFSVVLLLVFIPAVLCGADNRPNILLIVSEDNGPELGCYGEPSVQTPVLDKLASQGVRFHRAFVPQAGCSQSRAALLTGLYPHQNGQFGLATWKFGIYRPDIPNLVRQLNGARYHTGIIGKLHINPASAFPFKFKKIPRSNFARKDLNEYAENAAEFFQQAKDRHQPFFLSVNYPDAHRPFLKQIDGVPDNPLTADEVKPLAYMGIDSPELREETANYYNCLNRLDSLIGDLLSRLDEAALTQNTLVIYMGDHGADLLRGKRTCYEGGLRVPLIVRWPGIAKESLVRQELVTTLDLLPTILEVAEADPIAGIPGRSLLPLLKGGQPPWRERLFAEYHLHSAHNFYPQRCVRSERFKLIQNLLPDTVNPGYGFTLRRFFPKLPERINQLPAPMQSAYLTMEKPPEFELYDLKSDPFELENLASQTEHEGTLDDLKEQLAAWRKRTNDPLLNRSNLTRLKAEIEACFVEGTPSKKNLNLTYSDYFFSGQSP